ncbi:hypothetical protein [Nocardia thraciensis]
MAHNRFRAIPSTTTVNPGTPSTTTINPGTPSTTAVNPGMLLAGIHISDAVDSGQKHAGNRDERAGK